MKEKVSCDLLLSLLDTKETLKELFKFCETTRNSSILFDSRKQNIAMLFLSAAVLILNACFFFLSGFSFTNIHYLQDSRGRGGYLFNSSLLLPPASQTLRYQPGDYCRELTSVRSQQPDSNREPLVSEYKPLTGKLRAHEYCGNSGIFSLGVELFTTNKRMSCSF